MKKKRILVTGGLGLLGKSLIKKLILKNHKIFIIDKRKNFTRFKLLKIKGAQFIFGDSNQKKIIKKTLTKYKIQIVFHLGAITQVLEALKNPYLTYQTNVMGTINIINTIKEVNKNILFIYSSSDKAYGEIKKKNYIESDNLNSIFPYDLSKSSSDLICQSYSKIYGIKVGILRCGNLYGPGDFNVKRIVPETILSTLKEKKLVIRSSGKLKRDYLFVDDASNAYYLIMKKLINNKNKLLIYNVGAKDNLSVIALANLILKRMNKKYLKPIIKNNSKHEIINQRLNYKKIIKEIGWKPETKLTVGIDLTVKWYEKNIHLFNQKK